MTPECRGCRERDTVIEELADAEAAERTRTATLSADLATERLMRQSFLALLHTALSDPDRWPRRVSQMKAAQLERARDTITEMFRQGHRPEAR